MNKIGCSQCGGDFYPIREGQNGFSHCEDHRKPNKAEVFASNSSDGLCVEERFDRAESEILKICRKYDIDLSPKYDDGVAVVMCATDTTKAGQYREHEREIDT